MKWFVVNSVFDISLSNMVQLLKIEQTFLFSIVIIEKRRNFLFHFFFCMFISISFDGMDFHWSFIIVFVFIPVFTSLHYHSERMKLLTSRDYTRTPFILFYFIYQQHSILITRVRSERDRKWKQKHLFNYC